ncbi:hypothetical protein Aph01nite_62440 [Acrocarpospora phusangensis]|uniref:Uncharacterized protein n=1 Tax=Acrocarpospora phusangensis TaxID=1070424 RepID=A0A919UNH8_9ACTN|nr:hypothetical protein [Acrocarpospora phusangensis]GIH27934.1 hypothetical protein Aph01nite_62440 [Acrocarpospora phusangensis]
MLLSMFPEPVMTGPYTLFLAVAGITAAACAVLVFGTWLRYLLTRRSALGEIHEHMARHRSTCCAPGNRTHHQETRS